MGLSKNASKKCHLLRPSFLAMATTVLEEELEACSSFAILEKWVRSNFSIKAKMCFGFDIQRVYINSPPACPPCPSPCRQQRPPCCLSS